MTEQARFTALVSAELVADLKGGRSEAVEIEVRELPPGGPVTHELLAYRVHLAELIEHAYQRGLRDGQEAVKASLIGNAPVPNELSYGGS